MVRVEQAIQDTKRRIREHIVSIALLMSEVSPEALDDVERELTTAIRALRSKSGLNGHDTAIMKEGA